MRKLLLAFAFALFATPALAQNTTCSDRPPSDSSNACANTRFVHNHTIVPGNIALPDGQIIVGNGSGVGQGQTMSGDCTLSDTGVITCTSGGGVTSFNGRTGAVVPQAGDYTAPQIYYTPPGTGGVQTTVQTELQRAGLWANDFGAACNGSGDDSTALQLAINAAQTEGVPLRFIGNCQFSTSLSITSYLTIMGNNIFSVFQYTGTGDAITVNTQNAVDFSHFYMSATQAAHSGISITSPSSFNTGSRFSNLNILVPFAYGLYTENAAYWILNNSVIQGNSAAVRVANTATSDAGDSTIYGNLLQSASGGGGIFWQSSGGLRIVNNKILGTSMAFGIQIDLASGATTADIFIANNSIEGITSAGYGVLMQRQGATGGLGTVVVNANETSGGFGMLIPTDANGVWLNNLVVTNNICVTCVTAGFSIDSVQGLVVSNNFIQPNSAATVPIAIGTNGPTSTNCVIGPNPHLNTAAASVTGSCSVVAPN